MRRPRIAPADHRYRILGLYCSALLLLLCASQVTAQESYELNDQDTWQLTEQPEPDTAAGRLAQIRKILAQNRPRRSLNLIERWIERNPRSPLLAEATMIKGDSLVALNDEYEALYDYEYIIRRWPESSAFMQACEREFQIAVEYAHGKRRKAFGLRIASGEDEAEELFIRIQERMDGSQLAEMAGIELADLYFRQRRMDLAADMYAIFIKNNPRSSYLGKARRRLIYSNLATFKGAEFDVVGLLEAKAELEQLIATDPTQAEQIGAHALLLLIQDRQATKMLVTAEWYLDVADPIAAELAIRRLVERFPETGACVRALELIPTVLAQLPKHVLQAKSTPNYALLRHAILGIAEPAETEPAAPVDPLEATP
ncbi:MAG: outer membrane protein assembly factor BamD [Phycisphaerales bacterium]|nr:outer membrane protein assembly factor BamD [Phycisphaerales bacterium]